MINNNYQLYISTRHQYLFVIYCKKMDDMKKFIGIIVLVAMHLVVGAQTYNWGFPMEGNTVSDPRGMAMDSSGNFIVVGSFEGTVDFNPTAANVSRTAVDDEDMYLAKYDASGQLIWVNTTGGTNRDRWTFVHTDGNNNIVVGGSVWETADLDPSGNTYNVTSGNLYDAVLAKYDSLGNFLWGFNFFSNNGYSSPELEIDAVGNIYINGSTWDDSINFNPLGTPHYIGAPNKHFYYQARYTPNGLLDWIHATEVSSTFAYESSELFNNTIYILRGYVDTLDLDPSANDFIITPGAFGTYYLARYDLDGNFIDAAVMPDLSSVYAAELQADSSGNLFMYGYYQYSVDFDPSPNDATITPVGQQDGYVAHYNADGTFNWVFQFGGSSFDGVVGLAVGDSGQFYVGGVFSGSADVDPSAGTDILTGGSWQPFIAKYDTTQTLHWSAHLSSSGFVNAPSRLIYHEGKITTHGLFSGTIDFDPAATDTLFTAGSSGDCFLAQYNDTMVLGNTVAVSKTASHGTVLVYPNPTHEILNIKASHQIDIIKVIDLSGKVIMREEPDALTHRVNLQNCDKGIYVLELMSNTQMTRYKVVVQ